MQLPPPSSSKHSRHPGRGPRPHDTGTAHSPSPRAHGNRLSAFCLDGVTYCGRVMQVELEDARFPHDWLRSLSSVIFTHISARVGPSCLFRAE